MSTASNIGKLYAVSFLQELLFFVPIMVPFFGTLGFTMEQILLLESAFGVTLVILEIPTGYFADVFGRKLSLVLGATLFLTGITVFAFSSTFVGFLFGEIIAGFGWSFKSGAEEALLYDTLVEMKSEHRYKKLQGNVFFSSRLGSFTGFIAGGLLGDHFLRLPFYAATIPLLIAVPVALSLKEPTRHVIHHERWSHFKNIVTESLLRRGKLRSFLMYASAPMTFSLIGFWLYQRYMEQVQVPIAYFGIVTATLTLISGLSSKYAEHTEKVLKPATSLVFIPLGIFASLSLMALIQKPWAILFMLIASAIWGFATVVYNDFVQKIVGSDRRATVLSIMSMLKRALFAIFAPFIGWIADLYSINSALLVSAGIIAILSAVTLPALHKIRDRS